MRTYHSAHVERARVMAAGIRLRGSMGMRWRRGETAYTMNTRACRITTSADA